MLKPRHRQAFETPAVAPAAAVADDHPSATRPRVISAAARRVAAQRLRPVYSPIVLAGMVRIIELALVSLIGLVCYRWCLLADADLVRYFTTTAGISLFAILALEAADIYHLRAFRAYAKACVRLSLSWSVVFLVALAVLWLTGYGASFSGIWFGSYYVSGLLALIAFRRGLSGLVYRWTRQGRFDRRTVIVGGGDTGAALIEQLRQQHDADVRIIGVFDDRSDERSSSICSDAPKLGKVDDLVEFARHTRVDLVIVALPVTAEARILQMVKKLWVLPLDIRLAAHGSKLQFRPRSYSYVGDVPVFDLLDRPIVHWDVVTKWIFDKIVGAVALICVAPIMLVIAAAIKIDSRGPVLFRQRRYGFNNEIVDVYKFRSMYVEHTDATASRLVTRNDPRVTRVGRFIRRTSIDELPQLFNVVFEGNLSLVGPRPHALHAKAEEQLYDEAVDGYFARHRVKPGITGWAQINGWRGETDSKEKLQRRVEHDLYYIENWSILFDLWILARTPFALIRAEDAY
jgi:Undecaprenyl-phosphate glucose phosphotransferase